MVPEYGLSKSHDKYIVTASQLGLKSTLVSFTAHTGYLIKVEILFEYIVAFSLWLYMLSTVLNLFVKWETEDSQAYDLLYL